MTTKRDVVIDDTNLPLFSFNIPTYNAAKHLDSCLKSIFRQDYPREKIEVLVADGGSTDSTLSICKGYSVRVFDNPRKLADYGSKINAENSNGNLFVAFAADNELATDDWLRNVARIFLENPELSAFWCNMIASERDPRINRYYELIKSDPLMFFLNRNLQWYVKNSPTINSGGQRYSLFRAHKNRPLVWGANGLVFKTETYKRIMLRKEYFGDNDVFQQMIEEGNNLVAYSETLAVYHHHLEGLGHWMRKWKRNYNLHTITHIPTRNLRWIGLKHLREKTILWLVYSLFPILSLLHATYLAAKQQNRYWLYHPIASFLQAYFLLSQTLATDEGRSMIRHALTGEGAFSEGPYFFSRKKLPIARQSNPVP